MTFPSQKGWKKINALSMISTSHDGKKKIFISRTQLPPFRSRSLFALSRLAFNLMNVSSVFITNFRSLPHSLLASSFAAFSCGIWHAIICRCSLIFFCSRSLALALISTHYKIDISSWYDEFFNSSFMKFFCFLSFFAVAFVVI